MYCFVVVVRVVFIGHALLVGDFFFFQAEDGILDLVRSRGLGDVYKRQVVSQALPYCRSLAESLIASWTHFGRWMAAVELPLKEVLFLHPAPSDVRPYAVFFECPVRFDAGENTLVFARAMLDLSLIHI